VPATATAATELTLSGTVAPANADNRTITWSVQNAGTTGASISGSTLNTTDAGTVTVRATITNGASASGNYTQDFTITVAIPATVTIKGASYSTTLTELDLGSQNLTNADIAPLRFMTNLTTLNLRVNNITDISPLRGLTRLTWLNLFNNNITDISALSGMTNMETLFLSENPIINISALSNMTRLNRLMAYSCNISDVTALRGLTSLRDLNLSGNSISEAQRTSLQSALPNCAIQW
jgi:Leucine-rich repeat (LRR) protein